ncbi:fatty acid desaturase [Sulfitobacter sp. 1A12157]
MAILILLLTCFHFGGFHHEHHLHPAVPWWALPKTRVAR